MLEILREKNGDVAFTLACRMGARDVDQLIAPLNPEESRRKIRINQRDLSPADQEIVRSLDTYESKGIVLTHCSTYIRERIDTTRRQEYKS